MACGSSAAHFSACQGRLCLSVGPFAASRGVSGQFLNLHPQSSLSPCLASPDLSLMSQVWPLLPTPRSSQEDAGTDPVYPSEWSTVDLGAVLSWWMGFFLCLHLGSTGSLWRGLMTNWITVSLCTFTFLGIGDFHAGPPKTDLPDSHTPDHLPDCSVVASSLPSLLASSSLNYPEASACTLPLACPLS